MSDAGEEFEQAKAVTETIDRASQLVRSASGRLADAINSLTPLLPDCDGPEAESAAAVFRTARATLLAQLDTLDRATKALGA